MSMGTSLATVLVVDDAADVRLLARAILTRSRLTVLESTGGREALEVLRRAEPPVDLVVLDVQMPDMDGWDTLAAIRADGNEAIAAVPVVLCTVKAHIRDLRHAWQLGADGYLNKPYEIPDLIEAVRIALARPPEKRAAFRQAQLEWAESELARRATR